MTVVINGHFLDTPFTGSGQYTVHVLAALRRVDPSNLYLPIRSLARSQIAKTFFEHVTFPAQAAMIGARVVHVPYLGPPAARSCPLVVTVHDLIMLALPEHRGRPAFRLYAAVAMAAAKRAEMILADSEHTKQDLIRFGFDPRRIRVVLLAADPTLAPVTDPAALTAYRTRRGLPERFALYLGGFNARKNLDVLFDAVRQWGDLPLVIGGDVPPPQPPLNPDVKALARPLGDRVRWLGAIPADEKALLLSAATVFVYPSRYEGFGLPPLEAMTCGTPTVASNATSIPEVTGDAALLVSPNDVAGLVSAVRQVVEDAETRRDLRERGLARAATFRWERVARETLAAYEAARNGAERG